jgi:phosphoribosylglycinamide formyltransferase-1
LAVSVLRLGVLASGGGTNFQAIVDRIERKELAAEIAILVTNSPQAFALQRAAKHGIPSKVIDHHGFADRETFERALISELDARQVGLVCLAGFMRVLSPTFVRHYPERIMNIHPALLPAFKGLWGHHVHEAVIASGAKFSGCTVHFVTEDVDGGPIIVQRVVPVLDDDTPDVLAARVLEQEHIAYSEAVGLFAAGRLKVEGRRVRTESPHPNPVLKEERGKMAASPLNERGEQRNPSPLNGRG